MSGARDSKHRLSLTVCLLEPIIPPRPLGGCSGPQPGRAAHAFAPSSWERPMTSPRRRAISLFSLLALVGVLSGCAMMPQMGIRPADPRVKISDKDVCKAYEEYENYARDLQEAYHTRATQNRGWIYVAGI